MEPQTAKILSAVMTASVCLFLGLIPIPISRWLRRSSKEKKKEAFANKIICCLLCYGGGVLLATCFIHMAPEMRMLIESSIENGGLPETKVPIAEAALCAGLFLVYFIEELSHMLIPFLHSKKQCKTQGTRMVHCRNSAQQVSSTHYDKTDHHQTAVTSLNPHAESPTRNCSLHLDIEIPNGYTNNGFVSEEKQRTAKELELSTDMEHCGELAHLNTDTVTNTIKSFIVIVALSIHAIFEGMAVGLEESTTDVWMLSLAIGVHKFVIVFCLGVEMAQGNVKRLLQIIYVAIFAFISPVGTLIGLYVSDVLSVSNPTQAGILGILQAIAAGTLVYVVFFQLLGKERHKDIKPLLALLFIVLGKYTNFLTQIFSSFTWILYKMTRRRWLVRLVEWVGSTP